MEALTPVRHPEFAAKLFKYRKRTGKSQERIALEVGTSRRNWIRWERGYYLPSAEFMARIGEATGHPEEFPAATASSDEDEEASDLVLDLALAVLLRDPRVKAKAREVLS